jgi:hypothetical protein
MDEWVEEMGDDDAVKVSLTSRREVKY